MIDAFESRLADLLHDRLAPDAPVQIVARPRDGSSALDAKRARVTVRVLDAQPAIEVGDDKLEVLEDEGDFELRTVLRLAGRAAIELEVAPAQAAGDQQAQRGVLIGALDAVLVALHDETTRNGADFATDQDQGFELDSFRLEKVEFTALDPANFRFVRASYGYSGRFWPVRPGIEGDAIVTTPTRTAILPALLPRGLRARAGGADLDVPVLLDLRARAGASPRLTARMLGSGPPGAIVGDTTGLPAGLTACASDDLGRFHVVYRPPANLAGKATVRVELGLAHSDRPGIKVGEFAIEVSE